MSFTFDVKNGREEKEQREALVYIARTAEAAERYNDMSAVMRKLVTHTTAQKEDLTVEERNLLSVAYKNVIGARRASWRTLTSATDENFKENMTGYKNQVAKELEDICADVLDLLMNFLIKFSDVNQADNEARVFYLKMAGDYFRYRAESAAAETGHDQSSAKYYGEAYTLAEKELEPTHPIRLGLALNYSVCYYEILKNKKKACELAKKAFDQAISKLDKLDEADYKDSTLIMQLLRDNLTLWTSDSNGDEDAANDGTAVEDVE